MPRIASQDLPPNWKERTKRLIIWYSGIAYDKSLDRLHEKISRRRGARNESAQDSKCKVAAAKVIAASMNEFSAPGTPRHMANWINRHLKDPSVEKAFEKLHRLFRNPPTARAGIEKAKEKEARVQIKKFEKVLKGFNRDNGFYPSTEQGLSALVWKPAGRIPGNYPPGGYLDYLPNDPWGNPYVYFSVGKSGYEIDWEAPELHLGVQALDECYHAALPTKDELGRLHETLTEKPETGSRRGPKPDLHDFYLVGSLETLFHRTMRTPCDPIIALFRNATFPDKPPLDGKGVNEKRKKMRASRIVGKAPDSRRGGLPSPTLAAPPSSVNPRMGKSKAV